MAPVREKKLVIVESPAKAKTISQFLGQDYIVEASFGHVRDLPNNAGEIPAEVKKEKWSRLGVNVDANFEPLYIIPEEKKKQVSKLKAALREAGEILLATDEDREGESISWHLLQVLAPARTVEVKRIVFHEITKEAILDAVLHPRKLDEALVRAQESRRVLDRLYGYTLSPLLWKKVAPGLSAGRVQSVATRLTVARERQRKAFQSSTWWDLVADLRATNGRLKAMLVRVGGAKLATGKSFDPNTGELKEARHLQLDEARARSLGADALQVRPWTVTRLEQTPGVERPVPPFTTSTLQQESNRKLRFSSKRTMQIAQVLYEGIDVGGERVGFITYMRTDSLTLSEKAIREARDVIGDLYGREYLPESGVRYRTTSKNAQEAHEAIRPTDLSRRPQDVRRFLDDDQYRLYEMIWKRTIACQMVPARVLRTSVEISVKDLVFTTSGKQILFPGFLRAYVEGSDDPEAELDDKETLLPLLEQGQVLEPLAVNPLEHSTKPPARYTEASLVKKLEDEGIGRPSTYATIISTIQERGYIFKRANELIPTFRAFCVTEFLEKHFTDLVETAFTSNMESQLDEIAEGKRESVSYLRDFYNGASDQQGLIQRVEQEQNRLEFPRIHLGVDPETQATLVVKMGRFGPYIQRGEGGEGNFAPVPDDLPPADLSLELALELLQRRAAGPTVVATDPSTGGVISLQKGRFGDYLEVTPAQGLAEGEKPKRVSLPPGMKGADVSPEMAVQLAVLPRILGGHPESGLELSTAIGRFGPYLKCGTEFRSLEDWQTACTITLPAALEILSQPRERKGRGAAAQKVLREFGALEGAAGPVRVLDGRYGPYVTDGTTNANVPKGRPLEELTPEEVLEILATRAAADGKKTSKGKKKATRSAASAASEARGATKASAKATKPVKPAKTVKAGGSAADAPRTSRKKASDGEEAPRKRSAGAKSAETAEDSTPAAVKKRPTGKAKKLDSDLAP